MRNSRIFGMLASTAILLGALMMLLSGAPALAQDDPDVIGDLALIKYVCPSDIGDSGVTIPANCADANDPNGADVPVIPVDAPLSFLYRVEYSCPTGAICEPLNPISVTIVDDQLPGTTPSVYGPLVDANTPGQIDPGDVWLYKVRGLAAIDLAQPGLVLPGGGPTQACLGAIDGGGTRPTYVNSAQVSGPSASDPNPAAYCNPVATPTPTPVTPSPTPTPVTPDPTATNTPVTPAATATATNTPIPGPTPTPAPVPIPEPVTVVLFGTGLAALSAALAARKRSGK
jgi:hypothetical protein